MTTVIRSSPHDSGPDPEWLVNQIAHALRNPIFAALVQSEALALKAGDDEMTGRSARMIQQQLKRLENNLEELKAIFEGRDTKELFLKADKEAPYGKVARAMAAAREAAPAFFEDLAKLRAWMDRMGARPAVARGMAVPEA